MIGQTICLYRQVYLAVKSDFTWFGVLGLRWSACRLGDGSSHLFSHWTRTEYKKRNLSRQKSCGKRFLLLRCIQWDWLNKLDGSNPWHFLAFSRPDYSNIMLTCQCEGNLFEFPEYSTEKKMRYDCGSVEEPLLCIQKVSNSVLSVFS